MSRRSAREVKLTSKFEEFSTSRLGSIQRLAHPENHINNAATTTTQAAAASATTPAKPEKIPKIDRGETPKTPVAHETPSHKTVSAIASPETPAQTIYSQVTPLPKLTANGKVRGRPRKHMLQKAETVVKAVSTTREELMRLREENANLKSQVEQRTAEYEELKRQSSYTGQTVPKIDYDELKEKYQRDLTHAKRKEWCFLCLNPSRYYCCWNTTYCSQKCQVTDWYQRHMKSCERRKIKTANKEI